MPDASKLKLCKICHNLPIFDTSLFAPPRLGMHFNRMNLLFSFALLLQYSSTVFRDKT